jgi:hypothetical protein
MAFRVRFGSGRSLLADWVCIPELIEMKLRLQLLVLQDVTTGA